MRDIVSSNGGGTQQTKNKVAGMSNNSGMGTLTRSEYRSYRDFLTSYTDGKISKDDQESVSSTDSGVSSSYKLSESKSNNTSTSSLNSENLPQTEVSRTGSFRNYMDSYKRKKFSSVKPTIAAKQNLIKSEIVIQVRDPSEKQQKIEPQTVFVTTINGDMHGEDFVDSFMPPPPPPLDHQNEIGCCSLPPPPPMFSNDHHSEVPNFIPPPPPPPQVIAPGFAPPPPPPPPKLPPIDNGGRKWAAISTEDQRPNQKSNQPEVRSANHAAAANLAKILTQHLLPRRKKLEEDEAKNAQSQETKAYVSVMPQKAPTNLKPLQMTIELNVKPTTDVAPKLPQTSPPKVNLDWTGPKSPEISRRIEAFQPTNSPPKLPQNPPPKQQHKTTLEWSGPKSPEISRRIEAFQPPKFEAAPKHPHKSSLEWTGPKSPEISRRIEMFEAPKLPPKLSAQNSPTNGRSSPVDYNTMTVVPVADGSAKVSKSDPNVRKLVYNTYRGLLGAYNNKANDMIATLPRTMVREDRGVSKQLESMALQGGLEKLNGRINPNVEQE